MSLQERTLVVKNFDSERTTDKLLKELCLQGGPVRKVILRSDHAFVEFEDVESVGYTKALLDGVKMFNRVLSFEPKLRLREYSKYTVALNEYIAYDRNQRHEQERTRRAIEEQNRRAQLQQDYERRFMVHQALQPQALYSHPQSYQAPQMQYQHPSQLPQQMQMQPQAPQYRQQHQQQQQPKNFHGPQFRKYRR